VSRARQAVATVAVLAALVAISALFKRETCSCSGGLPYSAIALWCSILAAGAVGAYVASGIMLKRD